jgi:hypothetical protein
VQHGVGPADAAALARRAGALPPRDGVEQIYIHLERRTPPAVFVGYARLTPSRDALQLALSRWARGHVALAGVGRVAPAQDPARDASGPLVPTAAR